MLPYFGGSMLLVGVGSETCLDQEACFYSNRLTKVYFKGLLNSKRIGECTLSRCFHRPSVVNRKYDTSVKSHSVVP